MSEKRQSARGATRKNSSNKMPNMEMVIREWSSEESGFRADMTPKGTEKIMAKAIARTSNSSRPPPQCLGEIDPSGLALSRDRTLMDLVGQELRGNLGNMKTLAGQYATNFRPEKPFINGFTSQDLFNFVDG